MSSSVPMLITCAMIRFRISIRALHLIWKLASIIATIAMDIPGRSLTASGS
jgi:hypothetical protein